MAYTQQEIEKIYKELQAMSQHTGKPMMSMEELVSFMNSRDPELGKAMPENAKLDKTGKQIKEMMLEDLGGADILGNVFNDIKEANEREMNQLMEQAARKEEKLMKQMERQAIKDAQAKLQAVHDKQIQAEAKRAGYNGKDRLPYAPANERKQHKGRGFWNPIRPIVANSNFGSHAERHSEDHNYTRSIQDAYGRNIPLNDKKSGPIAHTTSQGILNGHCYVPEKPNGKVVIYFGGSADPASRYVAQNTAEYLKNGASVVSFDPRGFGKSCSMKGDKKVGTKLSEESMYADAKEMYNFVVNTMGVKPENIVLHGYSMGGAVASRLAADIAEKNQILDTKLMKDQGKHLPEGMRLGGLVLQSPISTNYEAAKNVWNGGVLGSIAGFMAWAGGGGFNTQSHMERLHKFDPNIPVHYTGGKPNDDPDLDDHLSPEITGIDKNPKAQFKNSGTYTVIGGHDVAVDPGDPFISEIAKEGRHADLGAIDKELKGPENTNSFVL